MDWTSLLPPAVRPVLTWAQVTAARARRDDGEVGIIGLVILVVAFAVMATALVAAITGKLNALISQIP